MADPARDASNREIADWIRFLRNHSGFNTLVWWLVDVRDGPDGPVSWRRNWNPWGALTTAGRDWPKDIGAVWLARRSLAGRIALVAAVDWNVVAEHLRAWRTDSQYPRYDHDLGLAADALEKASENRRFWKADRAALLQAATLLRLVALGL